jgi:hypothetical protein
MNVFTFMSRQMTSLSVRFFPKPGMSAILPSSTSAAVSMPQERRTAQRAGLMLVRVGSVDAEACQVARSLLAPENVVRQAAHQTLP